MSSTDEAELSDDVCACTTFVTVKNMNMNAICM